MLKIASIAALLVIIMLPMSTHSEDIRPRFGKSSLPTGPRNFGYVPPGNLINTIHDDTDFLLSLAPLGTTYADFTSSDAMIQCRVSAQRLSRRTPCYTCSMDSTYWRADYAFYADLEADACVLQKIHLHRRAFCIEGKPCPYKVEDFFGTMVTDFVENLNKLVFKELKERFSDPKCQGEPRTDGREQKSSTQLYRDTVEWMTPMHSLEFHINIFSSGADPVVFSVVKTAAALLEKRNDQVQAARMEETLENRYPLVWSSCQLAGLEGCDAMGDALSRPDLKKLTAALSVAAKKSMVAGEVGAAASLFIAMVIKSVNFYDPMAPLDPEETKQWHSFIATKKYLSIKDLVEKRPETRSGRLAVIELMRGCWSAELKSVSRSEVLDAISATARKGEEYLEKYPGTDVEAEVLLWTARAYEDIWSIAKSRNENPFGKPAAPDLKPIAEKARKKAIEKYKALSRRRAELTPEVAANLEYILFFLQHDIETDMHRFKCIPSGC